MADERGIQQTKELLDFIFSLIGAIKESTKDGEFTWSDGLNFIEPLKKIAPAIDDIEDGNFQCRVSSPGKDHTVITTPAVHCITTDATECHQVNMIWDLHWCYPRNGSVNIPTTSFKQNTIAEEISTISKRSKRSIGVKNFRVVMGLEKFFGSFIVIKGIK